MGRWDEINIIHNAVVIFTWPNCRKQLRQVGAIGGLGNPESWCSRVSSYHWAGGWVGSSPVWMPIAHLEAFLRSFWLRMCCGSDEEHQDNQTWHAVWSKQSGLWEQLQKSRTCCRYQLRFPKRADCVFLIERRLTKASRIAIPRQCACKRSRPCRMLLQRNGLLEE